ncbi:disulfide bond formation protein B [Enterococcus faecalis]|uniref:Disulfide bond formation protein B n=1 Tax=Enterococcus faecalis RP2S-4 TaxID=1244145 RepID=A0ABC9TGY0_ENTFL|nr:disulfide bond formation protein B [Enterococcus faecalis]EPI05699.1 hypothetical protein D358_02363 [Enterococcus faecalis RP2S-4]
MFENLLKKYGPILGLLANLAFVGAFLLVLWGSLTAQFLLHELPCPLCVLQRYSMLLVCLGPLFILVNQEKGELTHSKYMIGYGMTILTALLGLVFSGRQILLHIAPGDTGYGGSFLSLHFYTWSFVTFIVAITFCSAMMLLVNYFYPACNTLNKLVSMGQKLIFAVFLLTVFVIFVAIIAELGFNFKLPDDPVHYELFR